MGSLITLGLGQLEIDWGKNFHSRNHSKLFLPDNVAQIPYYYYNERTEKAKPELRSGYSTNLINTKRRLELLGYTIKGVENLFKIHFEDYPSYYTPLQLNFNDLLKLFSNLNIKRYRSKFGCPDFDLGEFVYDEILSNSALKSFKQKFKNRDTAAFLENLDPYIILRLALENKENDNIPLEWRIQDYIDGGWASEENIYTGLDREDLILIVTEGSTDSLIIKKAIDILAPDISDFFYFVDMKDNYPFTGSGNLHNFCKGLSKIKVQNKVLAVFDNDTEGIEKYHSTKQLHLPQNLSVMHLPSLAEFTNFQTRGPSGTSLADINNKAVSIECFLDLTYKTINQPVVRWTNFRKELSSYHGALENKDDYTRKFKNVKINSDYDFSKLKILVNEIYHVCTKMISPD